MGKNAGKDPARQILELVTIMEYLKEPSEIAISDMLEKQALSPSLYKKIVCKNRNTRKVKDLIAASLQGSEVGSSSYVDASEYKLIRTSSLQSFSFLTQFNRMSPVPIKPGAFCDHKLSKNDILYSKDGSIGECCIVESDSYKKHMLSSGLIKLVPKKNPMYVFAFLKHPFMKSQLDSMTPKGSTIKHSKLSVLTCFVPFPKGKNADEIVTLVEKIVERIISIESLIGEKDQKIYQCIHDELLKNQLPSKFVYTEPTFKQISGVKRLDAGIYSRKFKEKEFLILNYSNGYEKVTSSALNFEVKPGPSLEQKLIGNRIDSDRPRDNFYTLIIPTDISESGIPERLRYIGIGKQIKKLRVGDILVGESGTWRSLVLLSDYGSCITNAHGIRIRQRDRKIGLAIYVRCILSWYKKFGLFDFIAVGGSGGHISPKYFDRIQIPIFPMSTRLKIVRLYQGGHKQKGVWLLNVERLSLLKQLDEILDSIINDRTVNLDKYENLKPPH